MSHVPNSTSFSPGFDRTQTSSPSVSHWHDAQTPSYPVFTHGTFLNVPPDSYDSVSPVEHHFFEQSHNLLPGAVFHHVNDDTIPSAGGPELIPHPMPPYSPPGTLAPSFVPTPVHDAPTQFDQYGELVDRIEEQQEGLRDAREALLGSRFRLHDQRRDLGATRHKAATQAGVALDLLSRHLNKLGLILPENIQAAWSVAETLRDELGSQEVAYEVAEEKYTLQEWRYTEKEKAFIDGLPGSIPMPTSPPGFVARHGDTEDLTRFSIGAPDIGQGLDRPGTSPPSAVIEPPKHLEKAENEVRVPTPNGHISPAPLLRPPTSLSHDALLMWDAEQHAQPIPQSPSGDDLSHTRSRWPETRKRINGWLLDILKCSKFEEVRLRGLLSKDDLDNDAWWQLVANTLGSDSPDDLIFHTGDTTISLSQPVSTTTRSDMLDSPSDRGSDARPSFPIPLVPEDQIVDALEDIHIPASLDHRDLVDAVPKHVTFMERSPSALSTALTTLTRASSRIDNISETPREDNSSYTSTEDDWTICQKEPTSIFRSYPECHDEEKSSRRPTQESLNSTSHIVQPENSAENARSPCPDPRPDSPESERSHPSTILDRTNEAGYPLSDEPINRPLSPPTTRSCSPGSGRQPQCPFASFFRVNSPKPWDFPLLRLTPLPKPPSCKASHRDYLPFVSYSGSPFRLPGPTKSLDISPNDVYD